MNNHERAIGVRGARDLAELWRAQPVAGLRYASPAGPPEQGLAALSDTLRARAWREHCASASAASCVEQGRACTMAGSGRCRADNLFPMQLGGGAPTWRMATLFVRWRLATQELQLTAIGEFARTELGWAARCLRERHGFAPTAALNEGRFADLELRGAKRWRLLFVTPWIIAKNAGNTHDAGYQPRAMTVAHELGKSMRARAHKFTALCSHDATWQRLGAHLAHHVADALLPTLRVEQVRIEPQRLPLTSKSNAAGFEALAWSGEVVLQVDDALLPWLSLLALCGGGENADKGFGAVELLPLV
jgi:hypothetical protein